MYLYSHDVVSGSTHLTGGAVVVMARMLGLFCIVTARWQGGGAVVVHSLTDRWRVIATTNKVLLLP